MGDFGGARTAKKQQYDQKLCSYLDKYTKCIVVHADNVGSNQLMMIRKASARLRGCCCIPLVLWASCASALS